MEQEMDQYYWYHFLATMAVLLCAIMYYYPLIAYLLGTGLLAYFYVKSQERIVEQSYQSLVDNTPTRSPSQESQK
jgi:hypothetical protein